MNSSSLILASASPRRAELLTKAAIPFEVIVSPTKEPSRKPALLPTEIWPTTLAYIKAAAVQNKLNNRHPTMNNRLILAADTIVISPTNHILNKARHRAHAKEILLSLAGKTHTVITGLCLLQGPRLRLTAAAATCKMKRLSPRELDAYLDSNLWKGKAGAYGLQDPLTDPFITLLAGDPTTVIGLPMQLLQAELATFPRD
jgi:septum formation protein